MATRFGRLLIGSACLPALALAGCGGGSNARPQPAPPAPSAAAPTPTPTPPPPAPTPTPTPSVSIDREYQRSEAAYDARAIDAHVAGSTGSGVTLAIVDSGIDTDNPEFAGRIHSASADMVSTRGVDDREGHGTAVASVAAAARNGSGIQGVAYGATILALRTEETGVCDPDDGCQHADPDISRAIDVARVANARVINISLGGGAPNFQILSAINRATAAGIVVVISAGNDGDTPEGGDPDPFALESARNAGNGLVIIAGSHNAARSISFFSNRAGEGAAYYLTARGEDVLAYDQAQQLFYYSGTSFAAPAISGAVALLAQAFPTLSGQQIVSLLFDSADDAGAAGDDSVYGQGIINLARAFQPRGTTSLAGSGTPVSLVENGQGSAAMGDGGQGSMGGVVILDGYSRAYAVDLARTLARAPQERPLAGALQADLASASAFAGTTSVSVTMRRNLNGRPEVGLAQTGLSHDDARKARAIAGHAVTRLTPSTAAALGFAESGRALQQRLQGAEHKAFLVARDPLARTGFAADSGSALGLRHDLGPVALTVTSETGKVADHGFRSALREPSYSIGSATLDRRFGPAHLSLGVSRLDERETILGGRFSSAFGTGGSTSWFVDAAASFDLGRGWAAAGSYRRGRTSLPGGSGLAQGGSLATDAFAFDLAKRDAFAAGDSLAFRVMQPLRVRSGGFDLNVPVAYDYFTGEVGYEARRFSLAPSGRELDFEAAYGLGPVSANLFLRTDPGHVAAMSRDVGGAIRFTLGF